jgi:GNAT superfamily N-acetyltransferase
MELVETVEQLKAAHPGLVVKWRKHTRKKIEIDLVYLPVRARQHGTGTVVMQQLCAWADGANVNLIVEPMDGWGTPVSVLVPFYGRFGFVPLGRKKMSRVAANG